MTDATQTVALAPIVQLLEPLVQTAVVAALGVVGSWVIYLAGKWCHIQLDQAAVNTVVAKAQTIAGQLIAGDANNLAGKSVTIKDPRIANAASSIVEKLPAAMRLAGWDEDRIAKLIAGELGKLQAKQPIATTKVG